MPHDTQPLVGEGQLGWSDFLGGLHAVVPVGVSIIAIVASGAFLLVVVLGALYTRLEGRP